MKKTQLFWPKYWVVHDKNTDDVFIDTAHKSQRGAIELFVNKYGYKYLGVIKDEDTDKAFLDDVNLECVLVQISPLSLE